ncbi:MAG: NAD-dependent epimerase/dehydratase family protein [Vicinamibacteria bacterium]
MPAVAIENASFAVTGGCGFIGARVVQQLLDQGAARVLVLDSLKAGRRERLPEDARIEFVRTTLGDVTVDELVLRLRGVAGVFHLAAEKHRPSLDSPRELVLTNVLGTRDVIEAGRAAGIRKLVFSSSLYAYGRMSGAPMVETEPCHPHTLYGTTKLAGETLVDAAYRSGAFAAVSLRYFFVYGERQYVGTGYKSVVVSNFERLRRNQPPLIHGDGEQALDYSHVDDIARATVLAMSRAVNGKVLNVGSGRALSVNELTGAMMQASGVRLDPAFDEADATALSCRVANTGHAESLLGFRSHVPLDAGLRSTWEWIRAQPL